MFGFNKGQKNGVSRKVPQENEPVLLIEAGQMRADLIEPILQVNKIPYERRGTLGAAVTLKAGTLLETYRFYVPYGLYEKCRGLIADFLPEKAP